MRMRKQDATKAYQWYQWSNKWQTPTAVRLFIHHQGPYSYCGKNGWKALVDERQLRILPVKSVVGASASTREGRLYGISYRHKSMPTGWQQMLSIKSTAIMVVYQLLPLSTGLERTKRMDPFRRLCAFDHGGGSADPRLMCFFMPVWCVFTW